VATVTTRLEHMRSSAAPWAEAAQLRQQIKASVLKELGYRG
jgi:hypothetical protein